MIPECVPKLKLCYYNNTDNRLCGECYHDVVYIGVLIDSGTATLSLHPNPREFTFASACHTVVPISRL